MYKLFFSLGVISFGLALGYAIQTLAKRGHLRLGMDIDSLRKLLQKIGIWGFMSIAFMGAIWAVKVDDPSIAALPALGVGALVTGGLLGLASARFMGLERKKSGTMFICGFFSNLGSIGGLICYVFLGEAGLALLMLYRVFEASLYYAVGFPMAKYYSGAGGGDGFAAGLREVFIDPFVLVALSALFAGAILNLSGIPRPRFFQTVIEIFVPMGATFLLVSVGLGMKFNKMGAYLKECLATSLIKFIVIPVLVGAAAYLMGYGNINHGLPLKVVLIAGSMPVAFNALVASSIYDLDLDLANSCWFVTNVGLFLVVPWLYFVINLI